MAGWRKRTDSFGNPTASFEDTVGGVKITAYLQDCDGDGVSWNVCHNDEIWVYGEVSADRNHINAEKEAWNEAMLIAQAHICISPGYPMVFAYPPYLWAKVCLDQLWIKYTV